MYKSLLSDGWSGIVVSISFWAPTDLWTMGHVINIFAFPTAYPDSIFTTQHAEQKLQLLDSDAIARKNPQHINKKIFEEKYTEILL